MIGTVSKLGSSLFWVGGGSLTGAALGGRTLPELVTLQPSGRPGYVVTVGVPLVARVVGVHPPALGCATLVDLSLCVPWKGIGPLFVVADTSGADDPAGEPFPPLEFTDPPTAVMDCQVPSVPVYLY